MAALPAVRPAAPARLTAAEALRLTRFPFVRKAISEGLYRAKVLSVDLPETGRYVRFRLADPRTFHPALFSTLPVGRRGTLLVIGTPRAQIRRTAEFAAFMRRMGWDPRRGWARRLGPGERRSLIYQLRRGGLVGGARTQAVLVPRARVEAAAARFLRRPEIRRAVAANPEVRPVAVEISRLERERDKLAAMLARRPVGDRTFQSVMRELERLNREIRRLRAGPHHNARRNPILATLGIGNPPPRRKASGAHKAFDVWIGRKRIDTVFAVPTYTVEEMRRSLVEHDGYDPRIRVTVARRFRPNPLTRGEAAEVLWSARHFLGAAKRQADGRSRAFLAGRAAGLMDAAVGHGPTQAQSVGLRMGGRIHKASGLNPPVPEEERRRLVQAAVTLDGEPAKIGGVKLPFAQVASLVSGRRGEWSWDAARRIVTAGGRFRSNPLDRKESALALRTARGWARSATRLGYAGPKGQMYRGLAVGMSSAVKMFGPGAAARLSERLVGRMRREAERRLRNPSTRRAGAAIRYSVFPRQAIPGFRTRTVRDWAQATQLALRHALARGQDFVLQWSGPGHVGYYVVTPAGQIRQGEAGNPLTRRESAKELRLSRSDAAYAAEAVGRGDMADAAWWGGKAFARAGVVARRGPRAAELPAVTVRGRALRVKRAAGLMAVAPNPRQVITIRRMKPDGSYETIRVPRHLASVVARFLLKYRVTPDVTIDGKVYRTRDEIMDALGGLVDVHIPNPRRKCPPGFVLSRTGKCVRRAARNPLVSYRDPGGRIVKGVEARYVAVTPMPPARRVLGLAHRGLQPHRRHMVGTSIGVVDRNPRVVEVGSLAEIPRTPPSGVEYRIVKRPRPVNTVNRNPAAQAIRVPFRDGQKVAPAQMRQWLGTLPRGPVADAIRARFAQAMRQYKRFHLGAEPTSFTYKAVPMGSAGRRITDVDVVVSEGKEWMAPYQVPPHSRKYDPKTQGRYIHAHGDSDLDVRVKRPVNPSRLPERFHTADGKFVGVIPGRVKITDWYRK